MTVDAIDRLLSVGARMANLCFNLSQIPGASLRVENAAAMKLLQIEWDAARADLVTPYICGDEPRFFDLRARVEQVADRVREMDEATRRAIGWTGPVSCDPGRKGMPCRCAGCIDRAARYSAEFAQEAARCAITLESLLEGAPVNIDKEANG